MSTPLERLDDAIHAFIAETGGEGKAITGWVLGCSTSRIEVSEDDSLPLVTGATYSFGPQTSTTDAGGIVQFLSVVIERAHWGMLADDN